MGKKIAAVLLYIRIIVDHIIDFFFGLYWDKRKRVIPIPELGKKHAVLAESAVSLAKKIRNKELRSEDLVTALIERIKEVNPIINAVAAERYEAALVEAKEVDALVAAGLTEEQWQKKPFLGVPFTAKESQSVKGMPLTMGLWSRRKEVGSEDSQAVAMLKEHGAILIATSNLPELLVWQETSSPVYGLTKNPHHTGRTVGGSSGAEAALVASYASPISLCSDIGGSTRMPAFYCGMFGYHPTPGTNSLKGVFFRKRDYENSMFALGFIAKHAEDLAPLSKTICISDKLKDKVDQEVNIKDIKVYYMESAPDYQVSSMRPELRTAMKRAIKKLTQASSSTELAPQPYQHRGFSHMYRLWNYWMSKEPDNYAEMFTNFNGEANCFVELIKKVLGQSKHYFFTVLRLIELQLPLPDAAWAEETTKEMRDDLISKLGDNGVLLLPSAPHAAPYHHSCLLRPYNFAYFAVVNALRCPAVQVPIGKNSEDLPLGIQVVAAPYHDALCLAVARYLEKELGGAVMPCKIRD